MPTGESVRTVADANAEVQMTDFVNTTSRRAVLTGLTVTPIATLPGSGVALPRDSALATLLNQSQPVPLRRTKIGRADSLLRYHNAESFFGGIEKGIVRDPCHSLYQVGIVIQLGLSSHLLDVGFNDQWCARHVGLNISLSLAFANASGFGFELAEFDLLAATLSPYSQWRSPLGVSAEDPFTLRKIRMLTRGLLDHVHHVTGHPRPQGWNARHA